MDEFLHHQMCQASFNRGKLNCWAKYSEPIPELAQFVAQAYSKASLAIYYIATLLQ